MCQSVVMSRTEVSLLAAIHRADSRAIFSRGQSADAVEGVTAFLEKRPADFPDRVSDGLPDVFAEIQAAQVEIEGRQVLLPGLVPALEHAAIHQKARVPGFHQGARAGDLAGAAEEAKFHARGNPARLVCIVSSPSRENEVSV